MSTQLALLESHPAMPAAVGQVLAASEGKRGLAFPVGCHLTWAEFTLLFNRFDRRFKMTPWDIGDLLVYGESRFGEDSSQVLDPHDCDHKRYRGYMFVSAAYPIHERTINLSHTHYEIANFRSLFPTLEQRQGFLREAYENTWTTAEMLKERSERELLRLAREHAAQQTLQSSNALEDALTGGMASARQAFLDNVPQPPQEPVTTRDASGGYTVQVHVTEQEHAHIVQQSRALGLPVDETLRRAGQGQMLVLSEDEWNSVSEQAMLETRDLGEKVSAVELIKRWIKINESARVREGRMQPILTGRR